MSLNNLAIFFFKFALCSSRVYCFHFLEGLSCPVVRYTALLIRAYQKKVIVISVQKSSISDLNLLRPLSSSTHWSCIELILIANVCHKLLGSVYQLKGDQCFQLIVVRLFGSRWKHSPP